MAKGSLKIHSQNILPIIKKWLYTDREIFIRELVSNACDAISKTKVLRDHTETDAQDEEFRIDIKIDKKAKTLTITDTGIGMTEKEVEKYIAQLAFSGAEEFINKYQKSDEKDPFIGHFGLGFYSAFMVSDQVDINTLSYQKNARPVHWTSDGTSEYNISDGTRETRGTEITLHINDDNQEYLNEDPIKTTLKKYCLFLPSPIYLNDTLINDQEPLWLKPASECTEKDYLALHHTLYPMEPDPIFWVHLNVDYPFHLQGILYFPKVNKRFDFNKNNIQLYCNRVFVSDNCKDLIPDYLMVLRGVIDSPDIPLNVSRSSLQMDSTVRQLSTHISKKVSDKLTNLYTSDRDTFITQWPDIELIIKLGVLQDDKFYKRVKSFILWKNNKNEWTTVEEYLERNKEKHENKVYYHTLDEHQQSQFLNMYTKKGIETLHAHSYLDTPLMNHLEGNLTSLKFSRIDGLIDDVILDNSRAKTVLNADGKSDAANIADFFRSKFTDEKLEVEAKSLASDDVPAFVVLKEDIRRMRDYLSVSGQESPGQNLMNQYTFVVNTNNKLINSIHKLDKTDPQLAKEMTLQIYELSLLAQKELDPGKLMQLITRSTSVLEKLAIQVTTP